MELEAVIIELEEEILDRETQDRLLTIPKRLFVEAQDYHRKGKAQEARLTINCACRLLERAMDEFKKWTLPQFSLEKGGLADCAPFN